MFLAGQIQDEDFRLPVGPPFSQPALILWKWPVPYSCWVTRFVQLSLVALARAAPEPPAPALGGFSPAGGAAARVSPPAPLPHPFVSPDIPPGMLPRGRAGDPGPERENRYKWKREE